MQPPEPQRLTPTQQAVVDRPASAQSLVIGGAGTGKTQVLIERVAKLVSVDALAPGDEVLVLTFGRETAAELRRRASAAGGDAAYIRVATFDSFATGLLAAVEPDGTWTKKDYDPRIASANRCIRDDQRVQRYLSRLRHIIVDEIQDLVGVRAEFVLTLLQYAKCGFTLLGDPAQAIFNFQLNGPERERGSEPLFDSLRESFSSLGTYTLADNFRAQTEQTRSPLKLGLLLGGRNADYGAIQYQLETLLLRAEPAPPLGILDRRGGTGAVLCYTNAQALLLSKELFSKGVVHEYRRALSDRAIASWVGEVLGPRTETHLPKRELAELLVEVEGSPDLEDAWKTLKAMDPGTHATLRLDRMGQNIRSGAVAGDPSPHRSPVVVSTIHRAKGLEFDWAVVVKPKAGNFNGDWTPAEEARLLFVALTRAREGFSQLDPPDTRGWSTVRDAVEGRWTLVRRSLEGIEVRGSDIRADVPPGFVEGSSGESSQGTQLYIRSSVRAGDPVFLRLDDSQGSLGSHLRFHLYHEKNVVGETSEAFAQALKRVGRLPKRRGKSILPLRIDGLRVEAVDTVAGTQAAAERARLEGLGIWNRVRVFGLGEVIYPSAGSGVWAT